MGTTSYKELLARLGCLVEGRFVCPPNMKELTIIVSHYGGGVSLTLNHSPNRGSAWTYNDDFILHDNGQGRTTYYDWSGMVAVFTSLL